jgi:hypothetical protein
MRTSTLLAASIRARPLCEAVRHGHGRLAVLSDGRGHDAGSASAPTTVTSHLHSFLSTLPLPSSLLPPYTLRPCFSSSTPVVVRFLSLHSFHLASCGLALAGAIHQRHPSYLHVGRHCLSTHLLNLIHTVIQCPSFLPPCASPRSLGRSRVGLSPLRYSLVPTPHPLLASRTPGRLKSTLLSACIDSSSSPHVHSDGARTPALLTTPVAVSLSPNHSLWFRRWGRLAGHTCLSSADCGRRGRNPGSIWAPRWRTSIARVPLSWRVGPWGEGYVVIKVVPKERGIPPPSELVAWISPPLGWGTSRI